MDNQLNTYEATNTEKHNYFKPKGKRVKNTIATITHNPKNATVVPALQIVELGKVTLLTLGYKGNLAEHSRPNAWTTGSDKI